MCEELPDEEFISKLNDKSRDTDREIPKEAAVEGKEENFRKSLAASLSFFLIGQGKNEKDTYIDEKYDITLFTRSPLKNY